MSAPAALTLRAEVARKALHAATAALPIAWAYGALTAEQVRAALSAAVAIAVIVELLRRNAPSVQSRFLAAVGPLLRAREEHALTGATWLALGMASVAWLAPERAAIAALWAAAVGDAAAALAGRAVRALRRRPATGKTIAGAVACALATALGARWLLAVTPGVAAALGVVAAAAEWPARPGDDNLRITLAVAVAATLPGLR
ncbi:MAG: hypothetical protein KF689_13590 [Gemmatimonadaceae bacterium]|nr:hypothetical protein [Gemmatimonadaceae bacterium]MCW5826981.1 hypothetical protein [Gemmatimonadaceae bacterium]